MVHDRQQRGAVSILLILVIMSLLFGYVLMQLRLSGQQTVAMVNYQQGDALLGLLDSAVQRNAYRYQSQSCDSLAEGPITLNGGNMYVDSAAMVNGQCVLQLRVSQGDASRRLEVGLISNPVGNAWSVGKRGSMALKSAGVWQLYGSFSSEDLNDLYCFDMNDCWISGSNDTLLHGVSGSWTAQNPASGENYQAIACSASDNCFVAGSNAGGNFIRHWDGNTWNGISYVSDLVLDIQCSGSVCYAAGNNGLLLRYNGSWVSESSTISTDFTALACVSDSECWATTARFKKNFVLAHRSGSSTWTRLTLAENNAKNLNAIACVNGNCWAGGDNGAMIRYVAGSWSYQGSVDSHAIYAIACRSSDNHCVAAGNNGSLLSYAGVSWQSDASPLHHAQNAVAYFDQVPGSSAVTVGLWREPGL